MRVTLAACSGGTSEPESAPPAAESDASTSAPAEEEVVEEEQPPPSHDNCEGDWVEGWYHFGEPATFTTRSPELDLVFSVTAPAAFTPADAAEATQPENVYFEVAVENLDAEETWDNFLITYATSGGVAGDQIITDGRWTTGLTDVGPDSSDVVYELDIDGLAGKSICFTQ